MFIPGAAWHWAAAVLHVVHCVTVVLKGLHPALHSVRSFSRWLISITWLEAESMFLTTWQVGWKDQVNKNYEILWLVDYYVLIGQDVNVQISVGSRRIILRVCPHWARANARGKPTLPWRKHLLPFIVQAKQKRTSFRNRLEVHFKAKSISFSLRICSVWTQLSHIQHNKAKAQAKWFHLNLTHPPRECTFDWSGGKCT